MVNWIIGNRTICIKMDLALNNLQMLICHKTQPTVILLWMFHSNRNYISDVPLQLHSKLYIFYLPIIHIYSCSHSFKYSYPILRIFKKIYWSIGGTRTGPTKIDKVNTTKWYSTLPRVPKLDPHHQIQFCVMF